MSGYTDTPQRGDILPTDKHRLEKDVESKWCKTAKAFGWSAYKFSSPGNTSVPDRLFLRRGVAVFIEFKRPGGVPTKNQSEEHKLIRARGFAVHVIDWYDKQFAEFLFE